MKDMKVKVTDDIQVICQIIEHQQGITQEETRLILSEKQLDNDYTHEDYGIQDDAMLHIVLKLRGD